MSLSTHKVEVFEVPELQMHPDADALECFEVFGGYPVVVRKGQLHPGDLAVYVPPDSLVPLDREEFVFLDRGKGRSHERIRAVRLRGRISMGLVLPAPSGSRIGDDVADLLGVTHYEPPEPASTGGDGESPPPGLWAPVYDVESWRRYPETIPPGEHVVITEKIHGCNARFSFWQDRFWCGSRTGWKAENAVSVWWRILRGEEGLQDFLQAFPGAILYGEVFGQVQDLRYGAGPGKLFFCAFDVFEKGRWWGWVDLVDEAEAYGVDLVPVLYEGPFERDLLLALADGRTTIPGADHCREGVVVKPGVDRTDPDLGRVILKVVGGDYLARKADR